MSKRLKIDEYESKYLSKESLDEEIQKVWHDINNIFKKTNELFVFDFTFVLHTSQHVDVNSTYVYIHKDYPILLEQFLSSGQALLKTDNAIVIDFRNINGRGRTRCKPKLDRYKNSFSTIKSIDFSTWHNFLSEKKYGGCSYILFNRLSLNKSEGEEIELGIYCVFKSSIKAKSKASDNLEKQLHQFLLTTGQRYALQHYLQQVKQQATRAAISQVMARNMSHNIGSHVMNRLTDGKKLEDLDVNNFQSYQSAKLNGDEKKIVHQMSFYNNYVKCRMDYLSDVTFGTPVMHTNKKVCGELFKEFDKVRLLLEFISGLSKFEYEIRFMFNGKLCKDTDDISIALPNDLLGCQAFYNIIENIIRNTAKHNPNKDRRTVFTVDIKEIDSLLESEETDQGVLSEQSKIFYAVEIYDDCVIRGNGIFPKEEQRVKDEYVDDFTTSNGKSSFGEDNKVSNIDWLAYNQNKKINQSVLQQSNYQLRTSSLGLMEMEASAAYLRKLDIIKIEDEAYSVECNGSLRNSSSNELNILKAINKDGKLGYRFFVSRPTEMLFIGDYGAEVDINSLLKVGIWFRNESSFETDLNKKDFVYNHPFVLYERTEAISYLLEKYQTSLPPETRLIDITEKKKDILDLLVHSATFGAIEEYVWKLLYDSIRPDDIEDVCVWQSYQHGEHNHRKMYNIALTPHAEGWKQRVEEKESGLAQYLEPLSSNAQKRLPNFSDTLESYIESGITNVAKYKLFESAFTTVLVIDERIQRFTEDDYESDGNCISNKLIYDYTNMIIPDRDILELDADNFDAELIENVEKFINDHLNSCKFLLLHYSILERMYGSITTINDKLIEWSKMLRVVVTSGRGKPAGLPSDHVCFVNLSPVLNVFVEMRSKNAINYLLHSARK